MEFGEHLRYQFSRSLHGQRMLFLVVDQVRVVHVGAKGHRVPRIQRRVRCFNRAEKILQFLLVFDALHAALLVAGEKSVIGDQHRQAHIRVLPNPDGGEVHVVNGLRLPGQQDDPSGVQGKIDIRMVASDIQRAGYRARGDVQHHRNPCGRLHRKLLQ